MKQSDYALFWQKVHDEARAKHLPLRVMFELTYKCNFFCRHCYVPKAWRRKKDLSTDQVLEVIRQLKAAGCFYLGFTGGEIFMRRDIWKITEFSRKAGMQIILYTNGSLIDEEAAKRIAAIGVNKVDITLPGISQKVFETVTGVKESHHKTFAAIGFLRKYKVELGFKSCMVKANQKEIPAIKTFCVGLGCDHRLDDCPSPRIDGSREPLRYGVAVKGAISAGAGFVCASGISQCAITPWGKLKLCPLVPWPDVDITVDKFAGAWESLPQLIVAERTKCLSTEPRLIYNCQRCAIRAS